MSQNSPTELQQTASYHKRWIAVADAKGGLTSCTHTHTHTYNLKILYELRWSCIFGLHCVFMVLWAVNSGWYVQEISYLSVSQCGCTEDPEYCVKYTSVIRFLNVNLYLLGKDNAMYNTLNLMHLTHCDESSEEPHVHVQHTRPVLLWRGLDLLRCQQKYGEKRENSM